MTNKRQRERQNKGRAGKKHSPPFWPQQQEWPPLSLLLPVNFGAPQSWVSTKMHIMSSRGGGRGEGCGRKSRWSGRHVQSVLLGRLHKWQLLSHDFSLSGSHLIVSLQSWRISNLPFGPTREFAYAGSWAIQSNETGIINWERIPNIHLTQLCTRVTADKVHMFGVSTREKCSPAECNRLFQDDIWKMHEFHNRW